MQRYTAYEAQVWARRQRLGGDTAAKIILMILSDYADEWGTCYPGVDRITEESELSRSTVLRRLKALAEAGLINIEKRANARGHRTSNRYVLEIGLTVNAEEWAAAKRRVEERLAHPSERLEEIQGVNVTPGSEAPPKCQPERGSKVSPSDTGTTSELPVVPPTPYAEQQQGQQGLLSVVGSSRPSAPVSGPQIAFQRFWQAYPRRVAKAQALKAFEKACRTTSPEVIVNAVGPAVEQWRREKRPLDKVPYPATWLNAEGWEDEHPAVVERQASPWANAPSPEELLRQATGQ